MKKLFFRKKEGFALIKLLIIVVAIILIIAGITIPRFLGARMKANVARAFEDMKTLADKLEMYYTDKGEYPVTSIGLAALVPDYITRIPKDPFGKDPYKTARGAHYRYYSNGDRSTPATLWLIVSNGPDGNPDVLAPNFGSNSVAGELGGPNGAIGTYYGSDKWSAATSKRDKGDIGRGGP